MFKNKTPKTETVTEEQTAQDTTAKADTAHTIKDSTANAQPVAPAIKDSTNFKIVIREYENETAATKAQGRFATFGYKQLTVIKVDSTKYQLAMPFTAPLSDTIRVRDSLKKIFLGKPYIITQ